MVQKHGIAVFFITVTMSIMEFRLKHSLMERYYDIILYLWAIFAVMFSFLCVWRVLLAMILLVSFLFRKNKKDVMVFSQLEENLWLLEDQLMILQPSSIVLRYLVILRFQPVNGGRRKMVVVFSDQFSPAEYRRLRLSLSRTAPSFYVKCHD